MSVVKVRIQKDFTVLYNGVLENPRLSFKAKGLWAYCMSRPDNWQFHVSHLATISKDGTDAVYSALKELEKEGLIEKTQKNEGGSFGPVDYIIYPYPQEIQIILPLRDFPETENPQTENPALTRTDLKPSIEEDIVLSDPLVASRISKIVKTTSDKKDLIISQDDMFRRAIGERKDWTPSEMAQAWQILAECQGVVNDGFAFMEGTIKNIRQKISISKMRRNSKNQKNEERSWNRGILQPSEDCPTLVGLDMSQLL